MWNALDWDGTSTGVWSCQRALIGDKRQREGTQKNGLSKEMLPMWTRQESGNALTAACLYSGGAAETPTSGAPLCKTQWTQLWAEALGRSYSSRCCWYPAQISLELTICLQGWGLSVGTCNKLCCGLFPIAVVSWAHKEKRHAVPRSWGPWKPSWAKDTWGLLGKCYSIFTFRGNTSIPSPMEPQWDRVSVAQGAELLNDTPYTNSLPRLLSLRSCNTGASLGSPPTNRWHFHLSGKAGQHSCRREAYSTRVESYVA